MIVCDQLADRAAVEAVSGADSEGGTTGTCGLETLEAMLSDSGVAAVDGEVAVASGLAAASDLALSGVAVPLRAVVAEDLERKVGRPAFFLSKFSEVRRMEERDGGMSSPAAPWDAGSDGDDAWSSAVVAGAEASSVSTPAAGP